MPLLVAKYLALLWARVNLHLSDAKYLALTFLPLADALYLARAIFILSDAACLAWHLAFDALPLAVAAYPALLLARSILLLSGSVWLELPVSEMPTSSDRRDMGTPETNDSVALNFTVSVRIFCRVYSVSGSAVSTHANEIRYS